MNYADIIKQKYPNYVLTHSGNGNVYEALQWSIYNPEPNPIPKATLDADIIEALSSNNGSSFNSQQTNELTAIANVQDNPGLLKKLGDGQWGIDDATYLTSITSSNVINALGFTPYNASNPSNYATTTYVDNLALAGVNWLEPLHDFNFIGTASAPPTSAVEDESYIIEDGGNTGVWSSFSVGDRVCYNNGNWTLSEVAHVGCRLGVAFDKTSTPIGDAAGHQDYIGEITGGDAINGWTWTWIAPSSNKAIFNNFTSATKFGQAYTYDGDLLKWIAFLKVSGVDAGDGISYANGSTLNINTGNGLKITSDNVAVNLYLGGGLITTLDGSTPSSSQGAGLALEPVFSSPGTYKSVYVDSYGRVTSASNPTTLSGYGITDAITLTQKGANLGVASLDASGKVPSSQLPEISVNWSNVSNTPNTLLGYGITENLTHTVNGQHGDVVLSKSDIGLNNVDNTSDASKPISTATQTALNLKLDSASYTANDVLTKLITVDGTNSGLDADLLDGQQGSYYAAAANVQPLNSNLTSISNLSGSSVGYIKMTNGIATLETQAGGSGGVIKQVVTGTIAAVSGMTTIPYTNAVPLITAGTQIWAGSITPISASSRICISFTITVDASSNNRTLIVPIFRGNTCIAAIINEIDTSSHPKNMTIIFIDTPNTTSQVTYSARFGSDSAAATWYVNSTASGNNLGGVLTSNYRLDEIG